MKVLKSTVIAGQNVTCFRNSNGTKDFLIEGVDKFSPQWKKIFWYMFNEGLLEKFLSKDDLVAILLGMKDQVVQKLDDAKAQLEIIKDLMNSEDGSDWKS